MQFIIKLNPELFVKSRSLRRRHLKLLVSNIRRVCERNNLAVVVENRWDRLTVSGKKALTSPQLLIKALQNIPGVDEIQQIQQFDFDNLETVSSLVQQHYHQRLRQQSFVVKVKRKGQHDFTSVEAARHIGGYLLKHCDTGGVDLHTPECVVEVGIDGTKLTLTNNTYQGIGGYAIPSQGNVLSLISGGYDSAVASYQMMQRGSRVHFCFFSLSAMQHEIAVKQVASYLWQSFSSSHKLRFVAINLEPVIGEILERVEDGLMGVVLKRVMLKIAAQVADKMSVDAIVTGESIGQVSSQTMANLSVIDRVTDHLILRPLICHDKQTIVDLSRRIGVEDMVKSIPEFCGVISKKPTVAASLDEVLVEESKLSDQLIEQAINAAESQFLSQITAQHRAAVPQIQGISRLPEDGVIIDIRGPNERDSAPFDNRLSQPLEIPFYKLLSQYAELPQDKHYFLYCDQGVMSQMQALLLQEQGFNNVSVYQAPTDG